MNQPELNEILVKHQKWLLSEKGGENANLWDANLQSADLQSADLRGANLDFSCWPLWCGSLRVHIDDSQAVQLLYHLIRNTQYSKNISETVKQVLLKQEIIDLANTFHRADECGRISYEE